MVPLGFSKLNFTRPLQLKRTVLGLFPVPCRLRVGLPDRGGGEGSVVPLVLDGRLELVVGVVQVIQ